MKTLICLLALTSLASAQRCEIIQAKPGHTVQVKSSLKWTGLTAQVTVKSKKGILMDVKVPFDPIRGIWTGPELPDSSKGALVCVTIRHKNKPMGWCVRRISVR